MHCTAQLVLLRLWDPFLREPFLRVALPALLLAEQDYSQHHFGGGFSQDFADADGELPQDPGSWAWAEAVLEGATAGQMELDLEQHEGPEADAARLLQSTEVGGAPGVPCGLAGSKRRLSPSLTAPAGAVCC